MPGFQITTQVLFRPTVAGGGGGWGGCKQRRAQLWRTPAKLCVRWVAHPRSTLNRTRAISPSPLARPPHLRDAVSNSFYRTLEFVEINTHDLPASMRSSNRRSSSGVQFVPRCCTAIRIRSFLRLRYRRRLSVIFL